MLLSTTVEEIREKKYVYPSIKAGPDRKRGERKRRRRRIIVITFKGYFIRVWT